MDGVYVRVTHTGVSPAALLLTDIQPLGQNGLPRPGPVYLRPGTYSDLAYSSMVALSYESGCIRGFMNQGFVTVEFKLGTRVAAAVSAYEGWAVYGHSAGATTIPANTWSTPWNDGARVGVTQETYLPVWIDHMYDAPTQRVLTSNLPVGNEYMCRVNLFCTPTQNNCLFETQLYFLDSPIGPFALTEGAVVLSAGAGVEYQKVATFNTYVGSTQVQQAGFHIQVRSSCISDIRVHSYYLSVRLL